MGYSIMKIIFAALVLLFFASCERCIECSYTYDDAQYDSVHRFEYGEFCGTAEERENFEQSVEEDASEFDGQVECIDK